MILTVLIPVFNEERTIGEIIRRVKKARLPTDWQKEIIVVDDGSTDETWELVQSAILRFRSGQECKVQSKGLKIYKNEINLGKGAAVRRGIKNASGDVVIIQDADLEYSPEDYQKLLAPIISREAQVVYGSRLKTLKFRLWGKNKTPLPSHYLANRFLSFLTNFLYGSNLTDMETGYKVMTKEVYKRLNLASSRFEIEPEITAKILKMGYKIFEVPITSKPRGYKEGKKIKAKDAFIAVITLLKYKLYSQTTTACNSKM